MAGAFAGCLQEETKQGPATVSRVHTIYLDGETMEKLEDLAEDDPEAALRSILDTKLVVRVEAAGEYIIEYTKESGEADTKTTVIAPGVPFEINGVDPLAPVVVKRLLETVAVRAGHVGAWFQAGDMPLGFNATPGTKAFYDFSANTVEKITVRDAKVDTEEMQAELRSFTFDMNIPVRGTTSWELGQDTGDGNPLKLSGSANLVPRDDLISIEADVIMNGETGSGGIVAGVQKAEVSGSATLWWEDGQPVAGQFNGAKIDFEPVATAWTSGIFDQFSEWTGCSGKTRADRCTPEGVQDFHHEEDADEKVDFPAADMPRLDQIEDAEEREEAEKALAILQRLLAVDITPGDRIELIVEVEEKDIDRYGSQPGQANGRFEFSLEAVGIEDVSVPAGSFKALKLVELMKIKFDISDIPHPEDPTKISLKQFAVDETVSRATFWLDTKTNVPVKMEASMPMNIDQLLKRFVDSLDPSLWDAIGGKPIENDQWSIVVTSEASYALKEYDPATHFSALTGLTLAHGLSTMSAGLPMIGAMSGMFPFSRSMGHAEPYPYETPPYPEGPDGRWAHPGYPDEPRQAVMMNLAQAPSETPGVATFHVTDMMGYLSWSELIVLVDDESRSAEFYTSGCSLPTADDMYSYHACSNGDTPSPFQSVQVGDSISVAASMGSTFVVMDGHSGAYLFEATVA